MNKNEFKFVKFKVIIEKNRLNTNDGSFAIVHSVPGQYCVNFFLNFKAKMYYCIQKKNSKQNSV